MKCDYCREDKVIQYIDEDGTLCTDCIEGLKINWLEVIKNDAYSLEIGRAMGNSAEKRII